MRRVIFAAGAALFLHRLYDCLVNINPATGFFDGGSGALRLLVFAAAAAAVLCCAHAAPRQSRPLALRANIFLSALLAAGAVLTFSGSAHALLQLTEIDLPTARILFAATGLVGLAATVWLVVCAFWFVRGRKTGFYSLLSFWLYPAWLCLRAVALFSRAPINIRDSVTVAELFCPVALALCWLAIFKALVADGETDKAFFPTLLAGVFLCVGVGLPTALVCARAGDAAACSFFLADALCAAAAALFAAGTKPILKGEDTDAQQ